MDLDQTAVDETLHRARQRLLAERGDHGHWEGELSSSPLSTATAVFTLHLLIRSAYGATPPSNVEACRSLIQRGCQWLASTQNRDGGWGDTVLSLSNISTTALCWAALSVTPDSATRRAVVAAAEAWLGTAAGGIEPRQLATAIADRYGKDRTFSVPILTMLALAGRLGPEKSAWRLVPQLPFELAACPHRWFHRLRLPVVSYALPALIAIGQLRHHRLPSGNPLARRLRNLTRPRTLQVLEEIQPASGGFLEATPLTSFVVMSLIGAGQVRSPVVEKGVEFLLSSVRADGSWPIDTNLATWVTTLSINAFGEGLSEVLPPEDNRRIAQWLLGQQLTEEHPYTHAKPGGWAWTDLSGGVPDADDTPGALLALRHWHAADERIREAAEAGIRWLLSLQNTDGGMPTFCRGWGWLPFDRSSADLTAHTVLAWSGWLGDMPESIQPRVKSAIEKALRYLIRVQRPDGAWSPLWFGNQHAAGDENLTYGTSRVLRVANSHPLTGRISRQWDVSLEQGAGWLCESQNPDGGWGGVGGTPSSIEETALAVEGLACLVNSEWQPNGDHGTRESVAAAIRRGIGWLVQHTDGGRQFPPSPIGFYFANLWYFEKLYPLIYTVAALTQGQAILKTPGGMDAGLGSSLAEGTSDKN